MVSRLPVFSGKAVNMRVPRELAATIVRAARYAPPANGDIVTGWLG